MDTFIYKLINLINHFLTGIQVRGASSENEGVTAMVLGRQMMVVGGGDGGHHI